jgi:hypothetical protein
MVRSFVNCRSVCAPWRSALHSMSMIEAQMICDGCGQVASAEHVARRLRRLEWATRYRPLHVQTLLLGAVMPLADAEFVYADAAEFSGEAERVLRVAGIAAAGKSAEAIHHELQRAGIFVAHVLECPVETADGAAFAELLQRRVGNTLLRIRRSIKPKRMAAMGVEMDLVVERLTEQESGCTTILDGGRAFKLDQGNEPTERLRAALASPLAVAR